MKSSTHINVTSDMIELYRVIDRKFYTIEFNHDLKVKDAAKFFNVDDDKFKKMSRQVREKI